ncbi:hypothetical protein C8Q75DRAFT_50325 [Abortiporus biennis]|nr:hypothetical protein C8Q75DRAFT_50325 [Abortiporus biennis]
MSLNCLPIPNDLHFDNTLGAEFLGAIVSTFLTGIGTLQTYNYFFSITNNDKTPFRILVALLWGVDMLLLVFLTIGTYTAVITNFANPVAIVQMTWATTAFLATSSALHFMIRCMFIYRVWRLSKNPYLTFILGVLNCLILSTGSAMADKYDRLGNFVAVRSAKWLVIWVFTTLAFTDTLIAGILCYYLWRMKSHAAERTESQIDTLMRYAQHTGAATSLLAIIILITYLTMPDNIIFSGIYVVLPKQNR